MYDLHPCISCLPLSPVSASTSLTAMHCALQQDHTLKCPSLHRAIMYVSKCTVYNTILTTTLASVLLDLKRNINYYFVVKKYLYFIYNILKYVIYVSDIENYFYNITNKTSKSPSKTWNKYLPEFFCNARQKPGNYRIVLKFNWLAVSVDALSHHEYVARRISQHK